MRIVEILDSENINSQDFENWIEECRKFTIWYLKLGTHQMNAFEMEKAYQRIQPKKIHETPIYKILENERKNN